MSVWQRPPVLVGESVLWLGSGSGLPKPSTVRWIGHLPGIGPDWTVGLELEEALPGGGIDGAWNGRVLFNCRPKHGLLVPISTIIPDSQPKQADTPGFEKTQNATEKNKKTELPRCKQPIPPPKVKLAAAGSQSLPRPAVRLKRRIPTPPSSTDSEERTIPVKKEEDQVTLRVEERELDQEDSLKKRLRLFTDNGLAWRMNSQRSDYARDEVVIDSLYAQKRQQFSQHGRSFSDSTRAFPSSASSPGSRRDRNSIFSIFRWFKKEIRSDDFDEFAPSAPPSPQLIRGYSSRCGSVDSLFSTATANSFAFVQPALYRPFGSANAPEKRILAAPETDTYRNRLRQRDRIRELDKNITLKKKYHLFGSGTLHRSVDDVNNSRGFYNLNTSLDFLEVSDNQLESKNLTLGRKKRKAPPPPISISEEKPKVTQLDSSLEDDKENSQVNRVSSLSSVPDKVMLRPRHRRTVSDSAKDRNSFVHVKGKRKAPPPPTEIDGKQEERTDNKDLLGTQSLGRKKRPAPPPPLEIKETQSNSQSSSSLNPDEKQRLIENIAKLQVHAERQSLLLTTPPESPNFNSKMAHTVCNDSLKLERGVLKANKTEVQSPEMKPVTPTPVSPRPWYKRNMINKEKSLEKKKEKSNIEDWMPEVVSARGSSISPDSNNVNSNNNSPTSRLSNIFSRFEKPEDKRKSQISMLANISELDREAAEIVQKEQAKERAMLAAHDAKYYASCATTTEEQLASTVSEDTSLMVDNRNNAEPNSPKRSGARELISLFNSITNVTKVTVNSAFFSKEGPSIFTKEGIDQRFSIAGENVKTTKENETKEHISKVNGFRQETVIVQTQQTYLESPGVRRRLNLLQQDVREVHTTNVGPASPTVVIEEIEDIDGDKSKTQAMYEANIIRKHQTPSPTIPTIAEMSESVTSITNSPSSTIDANARSASTTEKLDPPPQEIVKPSTLTTVSNVETATSLSSTASVINKNNTSVSSQSNPPISKPTQNYSIWSCPQCTLENPRWRVTCEACDMWRPAVRKDMIEKITNANMGSAIRKGVVDKLTIGPGVRKVDADKTIKANMGLAVSKDMVDKLTNANMGATIAVNIIKGGEPKTPPVSKVLPQSFSRTTEEKDVDVADRKKITSGVVKMSSTNVFSSPSTSSSQENVRSSSNQIPEMSKPVLSTPSSNKSLQEISKPITVSGLLSNSSYKPKEPVVPEKIVAAPKGIGLAAIHSQTKKLINNNVSNNSIVMEATSEVESKSSTNEASGVNVPTSVNNGSSDLEEVRKARLAFFHKPMSEKKDSKDVKAETSSKLTIDQTKIDTLFSIANKGSLATNDEERRKIKEILKEMKNSLPKKTKVDVSKTVTNSQDQKLELVGPENSKATSSSSPIAKRLGAIRKSTVQNFSNSKPSRNQSVNSKDNIKSAEAYLVKTETIIEEIKVKNKNDSKTPKTSTSVQTNGILSKKYELGSPISTNEEVKPLTAKPPTPKASRKEILVPVTVEKHTFVNGITKSSTSREERKLGMGNFELIRPRDFTNIEATKTGNETKVPLVHFYANIPSKHNDDSASSSSSSDGPEITQLTAQLSRPSGLAEFKASVLESTAGNKMNTLAVNRLLRQLESAIVGGEHQRAATLAKQLAKHKVNCCVTRHKLADMITVDMYVEDKLSHQGPFPMQVAPTMSVAELKAKVEREFEIPAKVQRWILGKALAADDGQTLEELAVTKPHSPIFLYLVAPELGVSKSKGVVLEAETTTTLAGDSASGVTATSTSPPVARGWYYNQELDHYSHCDSESSKESSPIPRNEPAIPVSEAVVVVKEDTDKEEEDEEENGDIEIEEMEERPVVTEASGDEEAATAGVVTGTLTIGWKCRVCTLVNSPTRPGCLACAANRPEEYQVPDNHEPSADEQQRIHQDQQQQQAAVEDKMKNYQDLVTLENADLIASTEDFECSICLSWCVARDGVILRDCLHEFCRTCLAHTVQFTEDAEVKCPFRDHNYACDSTLQEREIKAVTDCEEDDSCIVCMAEARCCALTPCGHRAYCETCCLRLIELDQLCSLCRRKADGYLLIYL